MSDTGFWAYRGERWFVKQCEETGFITAEADSGSFTAANHGTWEKWKTWGSWERVDQEGATNLTFSQASLSPRPDID